MVDKLYKLMKKIVKGNDFTLRIPVMKMVEGEPQAFPLPACTDVVVQVCNQFRRIPLAFEIDVKEDNILLAKVEGDKMSIGTYAIEVKGKIFGNDWRSNEYPQFAIVANNADADTEFGETDEGDNSVEMDTAMVILPPSVELSDLINKANEALKNNKETNDTLNTNEEARKEAETQRVSAESERVSAEQTRVSAEDARMKAEVSRVSAESDRARAEDARTKIEIERQVNELTRKDNETKRVNAETLRNNAEKLRVLQENERKGNEDVRKSDEDARIKAESARSKAETKREEDFSASKEAADNATEKALSTYSHPPYADSDGFYHKWNPDTQSYDKTDVNLKAQPSKPAFVFKSVEEMETTDINNFDLYDYVIINTDDTEDEDNAKLYLIDKNEDGTKYYHYLVDMSGFRGFAGKTPQISIGTITTLLPSEKASVAMTSDGMDEQGNPKYVINFAIPQGRKGDKGDSFSYADFTAEQIKELQKPATDAANKAQEILKNAEIAINGAETVNAKLENYILSVTDREGNTNEINLNADETVNLTITSLVEGIKVAGMKVNVYLNNGKTPTTYTTDSSGHVTFNVERGTLYRIEFNEYGNAQPISPISYTATSGMVREISVEYKPYNEESSEKVIVTVTKYTDGVGSAWEGIPVTITYDGSDSVVNTDSNGLVTVFVPFGKEYSVKVEDTDGYYVNFYKNIRTYKASFSERNIVYNLYQYKTGIFILDANKGEYTIDEWTAEGKTQDEAVAIKIADINLCMNKGTFAIRTSDIKNIKAMPYEMYCTQDVQFNSIALDGNNPNDPNYYNGERTSFLVRQEAQERSLSVPAFNYAYEQVLTLSGEDLHGAIGSIGQFIIYKANDIQLKEIIEKLYDEETATTFCNFVESRWLRTSTQSNKTSAWVFKTIPNNGLKTLTSYCVIPFFAC